MQAGTVPGQPQAHVSNNWQGMADNFMPSNKAKVTLGLASNKHTQEHADALSGVPVDGIHTCKGSLVKMSLKTESTYLGVSDLCHLNITLSTNSRTREILSTCDRS